LPSSTERTLILLAASVFRTRLADAWTMAAEDDEDD
jgi:hypothetical protein